MFAPSSVLVVILFFHITLLVALEAAQLNSRSHRVECSLEAALGPCLSADGLVCGKSHFKPGAYQVVSAQGLKVYNKLSLVGTHDAPPLLSHDKSLTSGQTAGSPVIFVCGSNTLFRLQPGAQLGLHNVTIKLPSLPGADGAAPGTLCDLLRHLVVLDDSPSNDGRPAWQEAVVLLNRVTFLSASARDFAALRSQPGPCNAVPTTEILYDGGARRYDAVHVRLSGMAPGPAGGPYESIKRLRGSSNPAVGPVGTHDSKAAGGITIQFQDTVITYDNLYNDTSNAALVPSVGSAEPVGSGRLSDTAASADPEPAAGSARTGEPNVSTGGEIAKQAKDLAEAGALDRIHRQLTVTARRRLTSAASTAATAATNQGKGAAGDGGGWMLALTVAVPLVIMLVAVVVTVSAHSTSGPGTSGLPAQATRREASARGGWRGLMCCSSGALECPDKSPVGQAGTVPVTAGAGVAGGSRPAADAMAAPGAPGARAGIATRAPGRSEGVREDAVCVYVDAPPPPQATPSGTAKAPVQPQEGATSFMLLSIENDQSSLSPPAAPPLPSAFPSSPPSQFPASRHRQRQDRSGTDTGGLVSTVSQSAYDASDPNGPRVGVSSGVSIEGRGASDTSTKDSRQLPGQQGLGAGPSLVQDESVIGLGRVVEESVPGFGKNVVDALELSIRTYLVYRETRMLRAAFRNNPAFGAGARARNALPISRGSRCRDMQHHQLWHANRDNFLEKVLGRARQTVEGSLRPDMVQLVREIGSGAFGSVYFGLWRGAPVAVKVLTIDEELEGGPARRRHQQAILEASIGSALDHPNVAITFAYDCLVLGEERRGGGVGAAAGLSSADGALALEPNLNAYLQPAPKSGVGEAAGTAQVGGGGAGGRDDSMIWTSDLPKGPAGTMPAGGGGSSSGGGNGPTDRPMPLLDVTGNVYMLYIVQEFCSGGSLKDALGSAGACAARRRDGKAVQPLVESLLCGVRHGTDGGRDAAADAAACACLQLALDVACGLRHVHAAGIVHGDVSAGNVLLTRPQDAQASASAITGVTSRNPNSADVQDGTSGSDSGGCGASSPTTRGMAAAATSGMSATGGPLTTPMSGSAWEGSDSDHTRSWRRTNRALSGVVDGFEASCRQRLARAYRPPLVAKVADFGLSMWMNGSRTHASGLYQGTPLYIAPEVYGAGRVSKASDVYSYGVLLQEILLGKSVVSLWFEYAGRPLDADAFVRHGDGSSPLLQVLRSVLVSNKYSVPVKLQKLIMACLSPFPADRPSCDKIVEVLVDVIDYEFNGAASVSSQPPAGPKETAPSETKRD